MYDITWFEFKCNWYALQNCKFRKEKKTCRELISWWAPMPVSFGQLDAMAFPFGWSWWRNARQCRRPCSVISIFCQLGKGAIRMAVQLSPLIAYSVICEFHAFDFLLIEFRSGATHVSKFWISTCIYDFQSECSILWLRVEWKWKWKMGKNASVCWWTVKASHANSHKYNYIHEHRHKQTSTMHANGRNQRRELDSFSYIFIGCRCVFFRASILFMIVIFVFCIFSFEINKIEMERRLAKRRRCADVC